MQQQQAINSLSRQDQAEPETFLSWATNSRTKAKDKWLQVPQDKQDQAKRKHEAVNLWWMHALQFESLIDVKFETSEVWQIQSFEVVKQIERLKACVTMREWQKQKKTIGINEHNWKACNVAIWQMNK